MSLRPDFIIQMHLPNKGGTIDCFSWRGTKEGGIARAKKDAREFGYDPDRCTFSAIPYAEVMFSELIA